MCYLIISSRICSAKSEFHLRINQQLTILILAICIKVKGTKWFFIFDERAESYEGNIGQWGSDIPIVSILEVYP